jgi:hypothetical protein
MPDTPFARVPSVGKIGDGGGDRVGVGVIVHG